MLLDKEKNRFNYELSHIIALVACVATISFGMWVSNAISGFDTRWRDSIVFISMAPLLILLSWSAVFGGYLRRTRFLKRSDLDDERLFTEWYQRKGFPGELVIQLRQDIADAFRVPASKIVPSDRFDGMFERPGIVIVSDVFDLVLEASQRSSLRIDGTPDIEDFKTVDDYITGYCVFHIGRNP